MPYIGEELKTYQCHGLGGNQVS